MRRSRLSAAFPAHTAHAGVLSTGADCRPRCKAQEFDHAGLGGSLCLRLSFILLAVQHAWIARAGCVDVAEMELAVGFVSQTLW